MSEALVPQITHHSQRAKLCCLCLRIVVEDCQRVAETEQHTGGVQIILYVFVPTTVFSLFQPLAADHMRAANDLMQARKCVFVFFFGAVKLSSEVTFFLGLCETNSPSSAH